MKGLTVMLYVAGSAVAATVKHLLALTDADGVVVAAKPKWVCGVVGTQDRARGTVGDGGPALRATHVRGALRARAGTWQVHSARRGSHHGHGTHSGAQAEALLCLLEYKSVYSGERGH